MRFHTSAFSVLLLLAVVGAQELTSGHRKPRDVTRDRICREKPHFVCKNQECVPTENARCNGVIQCQDGSDEVDCPGSGCILPEQPDGGSFELNWCSGNSCTFVPGERVPGGSFITYKCDEGYMLYGNNISFCYINAWYQHATCRKSCPALSLKGVDAVCNYQGETVSCDSPSTPGTKASLACKEWHKSSVGDDSAYREITCLKDGTWDCTAFYCTPECGTTVFHESDIIGDRSPVEHVSLPWHVVIYKINSIANYEQICAGTLIGPDLVISAAHCFYDENIGDVMEADTFSVAAGKYYQDYNSSEPSVQWSTAAKIDIGVKYFGESENYAEDIALLRLKTPFTLTAFVKPICIDWDGSYEMKQLQNGNQGKALRWSKITDSSLSVHLEEIDLPYIHLRNCRSAALRKFKSFKMKVDKFCAGDLNGSGRCDGVGGGGISFENDGLWYLRGTMTVGPVSGDSCAENFYTVFTNVGEYIKWIQAIYPSSQSQNDAGELDSSCRNKDINPWTEDEPVSRNQNTTNTWSGCLLPEQPMGGSFEITPRDGPYNVESGTRVSSGSFLTYQCNQGYVLKGNSITFCFVSMWVQPPTCIKTCPALDLEGVQAVCNYQGDIVSCESLSMPGTMAILTCRDSYKIPRGDGPEYREITCLENGTWNHPVFHCVPECGTAVAPGRYIFVNDAPVDHTSFPWYVAIYKPHPIANFEQICAGTLISHDLVISAGHCFHDEIASNATNASKFLVVAGKYYRPYNGPEPLVQQSAVKNIHVIERYSGVGPNYEDDIALLRLVHRFTMTVLVKPICIDWFNSHERRQLTGKNSGMTVRWSKTSDESLRTHLEEIDLPYVPIQNCLAAVPNRMKRFMTADKSCAGHLNGSRPCDGDSGAGLFHEIEGLWYLRGIITVPPVSDGTCDDNTYTMFSNVVHFLEWIRDVYLSPGNGTSSGLSDSLTRDVSIHQSSTTNSTIGCIVPEQPTGGIFELGFCKRECDDKPGSRVPNGSVLFYRCNEGYTLMGQYDSVCHTNVWKPATTCVKTCPSLSLEGVDAVCNYQGEIVSCKSPIVPGTKVTLACKNLYEIELGDDPGYREITCLEGGKWDRRVFHCFPECGTSEARGNSLNVNGTTLKHRSFPWHVDIHKKSSMGNFEQICSGTLVRLDLVVSAAHCFYNEAAGEVISADHFTVAAGKYYRFDYVTETYAQNSTVKQIDVAERYIGSIGNHVHDIALLHLKSPFHRTPLVKRICIDWDNKYEKAQLELGSIGQAVERSNIELRELSLPYIRSNTCVSAAAEEFKSYITADKFCAGYMNGSGLCDSGSGSGIYFQSDGLWYLRGVSSVGPTGAGGKCDGNSYITFTNVGNFVEWIRDADFSIGNRLGRYYPDTYMTLIDDSKTSSSTRDCLSPKQLLHGRYELSSCEGSCNIAPGSRVPMASILTFWCDRGYFARENNTVSVCYNGEWSPPVTCIKKDPSNYCPALRSKNKNVVCKYNDGIISCGSAMPPGTRATLRCRSQHVISSPGVSEYTSEIICLDNGVWDRPLTECTYECGKRVPDEIQLIVNGSEILHYKFPWRVFIHKKDWAGHFSWQCDATLISPNLVITMADDLDMTAASKVDPDDYAVGVGYYDRLGPYDTQGPYAQKSLVKKIDVTNNYDSARRRNSRTSFALLHLAEPFIVTLLVRPVCIDWNNSVEAEAIKNWESYKTLAADPSYVHQGINLPYIPREQCLSRIVQNEKSHLLADMFCTEECTREWNFHRYNDHGNSFTYASDGAWYLLGIHNSLMTTTCNWFSRYSKVQPHLDWIRNAYNDQETPYVRVISA